MWSDAQGAMTEKFAQAVVDIFEESGLNGVSDEMSYSQIRAADRHWDVFQEASAYLGLIKPVSKTKEQHIEFRKRWDAAVDEGVRKRECSQGVRGADPVGKESAPG